MGCFKRRRRETPDAPADKIWMGQIEALYGTADHDFNTGPVRAVPVTQDVRDAL